MGDYDRLGRRIAWAATDDPVYASQPGGPMANRISFADVDRIAKDEGMIPGYAIIGPADSTESGETTWGSYTVVNRWPQKLSEQRTLYLDQFTGATITNAAAAQDGALSRLTSFGIAMHMGNQLGVLTRISATLACLGMLTSVATGFLMWWKRRPTGGTGLPKPANAATRAATPKGAVKAVSITAVGLGVLYPAFGVSLLLVLGVEAVLTIRHRTRDDGVQPDAVGEELAADEDEVPVGADDGDEVPVGALQ